MRQRARRRDRVRAGRSPGPVVAERRRHRLGQHRLRRDRLVAHRARPHPGCPAAPDGVPDRRLADHPRASINVDGLWYPFNPRRTLGRPLIEQVRTADLDYDLPPSLIAQRPAEPRSTARGCWCTSGPPVRSATAASTTCSTSCAPTTCVVLNDTRVLPVRVRARRATGGAVEVLLLEPLDRRPLEALGPALRGGSRRRERDRGGRARVSNRASAWATAACACRPPAGIPIEQALDAGGGDAAAALHPRRRWPTRSATRPCTPRHPGSAAAPTAGLHFTPALLERAAGRPPGGRR